MCGKYIRANKSKKFAARYFFYFHVPQPFRYLQIVSVFSSGSSARCNAAKAGFYLRKAFRQYNFCLG